MRARLLLTALLGCARSPAPSAQPDSDSRPAPALAAVADASEPRDIHLAPSDEPGQKLRVTGVLLRAESRTPLPHHKFRIYQADATGEYRAKNPQDERTARLSADVTTDGKGRFALWTIVPGVYGRPPGDPHLHIDVSAATPSMHAVYFDRFLQQDTKDWAKTTDQAHIVALSETRDGVLAGHLPLVVRGVPTSP